MLSSLNPYPFFQTQKNITKRIIQDWIWWNLFSKRSSRIWKSISTIRRAEQEAKWTRRWVRENHRFIYDWSLTVNMRNDLIWSEQCRVEVERFLSDDSVFATTIPRLWVTRTIISSRSDHMAMSYSLFSRGGDGGWVVDGWKSKKCVASDPTNNNNSSNDRRWWWISWKIK